MRYIIIDTANLFFRARHIAHRGSTNEEGVAFAIHLTLTSINKMVRKFGCDHVVFATEGRSWRKDFYQPYKANRTDARNAMTEEEQELDRLYWEAYDNLITFLRDRTNCSVIRDPNAEADDIIARWIALHPADEHVIISSDADFVQLVQPNVRLYNGVIDRLITHDGVYDDRGQKMDFKIDSNSRLKIGQVNPQFVPDADWAEYALFLKCMRGDKGDNVFSAYPGCREKGTKNRVGLREAYEDRHRRGWAWNNLMLQRWTDHNGEEHRVLTDYERNRELIDLRAQPEHIKQQVDQVIREQISHQQQRQIGIYFLKFCGRYDLAKISESPDQYCQWLNKNYQGVLNDSGETSDQRQVLDSQAS